MNRIRHAIAAALIMVPSLLWADQPQSPEGLLRTLSADLKVARKAPAGTYPAVIRRDVGTLVGASRSQLHKHLGTPDSCHGVGAEKCAEAPSWIYLYFPWDPKDTSTRGGGMSLHFELEANQVKRAYWLANR